MSGGKTYYWVVERDEGLDGHTEVIAIYPTERAANARVDFEEREHPEYSYSTYEVPYDEEIGGESLYEVKTARNCVIYHAKRIERGSVRASELTISPTSIVNGYLTFACVANSRQEAIDAARCLVMSLPRAVWEISNVSEVQRKAKETADLLLKTASLGSVAKALITFGPQT